VKFNERCFVRLLGDMRSYNFVVVVTPDFEDVQLRVRAMDFDQQSYNGRRNFYRPQFFKENAALALFCAKHLRLETASQYLREEQTLILHRAELAATRHGREEYLACQSMGALIRENLESIRRHVGRPALSEMMPNVP
jgi:hypothetical protein